MAYYFSTPAVPLVPMAVKPNHPGFHLFKHYRNMDAGINVFVVDGVVTTVEPDYEFTQPDRVYLGGHLYEVTVDEAALLVAAGYTVLEGGAPVVLPGLPGNDYGSDYDPPVTPDVLGFGLDAFGASSFGGTA